jgi:stress-induced morphogen
MKSCLLMQVRKEVTTAYLRYTYQMPLCLSDNIPTVTVTFFFPQRCLSTSKNSKKQYEQLSQSITSKSRIVQAAAEKTMQSYLSARYEAVAAAWLWSDFDFFIVPKAFEGKKTLARHRLSELLTPRFCQSQSPMDVVIDLQYLSSQRTAEEGDFSNACVFSGKFSTFSLLEPNSDEWIRTVIAFLLRVCLSWQKTFTPTQYEAYLANNA